MKSAMRRWVPRIVVVSTWAWMFNASVLADSLQATVVDSAALAPLPYDAGQVRIIATAEATGQRAGVVELTEASGYDTPWHQHDGCDETFYVLEGSLTLRIGTEERVLTPGSFVFVPRGTPHSQGNRGTVPVKLLTTFTPGGFEQFFVDRVELHRTVKRGDADFQARMLQLLQKHSKWIRPASPPQ